MVMLVLLYLLLCIRCGAHVRRTAEVRTFFWLVLISLLRYEAAIDAKLSRYAVQPGSGQAPWNADPSIGNQRRWHVHRYVFPRCTYYLGSGFEDLDGISGADSSNGLTVSMEQTLLHVESKPH